MTRVRWGRFLACLIALLAACPVRADATPSMLLAASGDDHVWWIDRDEKGVILWHATAIGEVDRAAPVRRVAARFTTAPEAIAAVGESLWLVFPPEPVSGIGGEVARREVLTLSTRRNPAVGHWYSVPPNGADPRPSLELPMAAAGGGSASGELLGFALDGPIDLAEPWILLGGGPAERLGVRLAAGGGGEFGLRLVRLDGGTWRPVEPPAGLSGAGARLVRTAAGRVAIIAPRDGDAEGPLVRFDRVDDAVGGWSDPAPIGAGSGSLVAWLVVDGRDVTVVRQGNDLELAYERRPPARPLAWTSLPQPSRPWAITGGPSGATLITVSSAETATRTRIPALGTFADAEVATFVPPGFGSGAWIHLPLLAALVLFILLGLMFLREIRGDSEAPSVAAARPFELPRRVAALAIDALPGAIVALVVLGARPVDLIRVPFSSLDVATAIPATLVAGSACLLGFLGEAFTGRSPGKWLLGGEVVRRDGGRAGVLRHLGRNLLKFLALVAPPLVIPTLLSADGLGVPERLTGTAVARRA